MSTADDFKWISAEAEMLYRGLEKQRQEIIDRYAGADGINAMQASRAAEAEKQLRAQIAPFNDHMVHLATKYTIPKPIIIEPT